MWGDLTDDETKQKVDQAFKKNHAESLEVLIYKKNSKFNELVEAETIVIVETKIFSFQIIYYSVYFYFQNKNRHSRLLKKIIIIFHYE
jgi:hypothetical protein